MHRAFRSALMHVGRHLLFVTIAVGAVVAFISISGGTRAQTSQPVTIVPIQASTPSSSAPTSSAPTLVDQQPQPAPARPPVAAATKASARPSTPVTPTSSTVSISSTPTSRHQYPRSAKTASSPTFHYVGSRNVAALINPARESQGLSDVTTAPLRNDAGCISNAEPCTGQIGTCGETPNSIGTAQTTRVYDGQYKDQDGNCLEVIVI
jgi:hypothetical protein